MASNRQTNATHQGRPLKPALASHRTARTPVAPRLATNASCTSVSSSNTFPRVAAPRVAVGGSSIISGSSTHKSGSHAPSLQPSLLEDASTPAKSLLADNVTPRSSTRKSRVDSTDNTPVAGDDTPSYIRPKLLSPGVSEPVVQRRSVEDARPTLNLSRPKSLVNGRDASRSQPTVRSQASTLAQGLGQLHAAQKPSKDATGPMFFHADQVKPQPTATTQQKRPDRLAPRKAAPFLHANDETNRVRRPIGRTLSPDLYVTPDRRSPHITIPPSPYDARQASPASPPLSAVSSKSFNAVSSAVNSPSYRPRSPSRDTAHLPQRQGLSASHLVGSGTTRSPASSISGRNPISVQGSQLQPSNPAYRPARSVHSKSQSLSSIDTGSPAQARGPASDVNVATSGRPPTAPAYHDAYGVPSNSSTTGTTDQGAGSQVRSPTDENTHGPTKSIPDLAAEARRERKVLDLEISNSSLLAINKSLEREIRKQKTELKRYRRLSRAGQFNVPARDSLAADRMSTLDEEGDDRLPDFRDSIGRSSSPFMSELAEDHSSEDDDSINSSAPPLSPKAEADKNAKQRAIDEERLRLDLDRHRELLLDTQRMNSSLQRCLAFTEDLIKSGQKALEYQVPSDVPLGGRILTDDDDEEIDAEIDEESDEEEASVQDEYEADDDILNVDNLVAEAMGGYFALRPGDSYTSSRQSGSFVECGSEKDSGIEISNLQQTPVRNGHAVEFGKPTPLRNPLVLSRDHPAHQKGWGSGYS
ncbi:hypothetical protein AAFC00_000519 [Neodothiora populina]|uniref:Uncharacterized protein n=1 Tax=Neodothiora populina TaxID=2781224 RepID=A0ABR3PDK1_9PEZI